MALIVYLVEWKSTAHGFIIAGLFAILWSVLPENSTIQDISYFLSFWVGGVWFAISIIIKIMLYLLTKISR